MPLRQIDGEQEAGPGKEVAAIVGRRHSSMLTRWVSLRSTHPTRYELIPSLPGMGCDIDVVGEFGERRFRGATGDFVSRARLAAWNSGLRL